MYRPSFAEVQIQDWTTNLIWFVSQTGRIIGPLSTLQLALAARENLLEVDAYIWRDGLPRWFCVTEVAGLLPASPPLAAGDVLPRRPPHRQSPPPERLVPPPPGRPFASVPKQIDVRARLGEALSPSAPRIETSTLAAFRDAMERRRSTQTDAGQARRVTTTSEPAAETLGDAIVVTDGAHSVTQRIAVNLADHVVRILERNAIKTFDDLASNERLAGLAGKTFDSLPASLRLALSQSVGRAIVEARIVDLLVYIRTSIPRHARDADLRGLVESQIPVLASYIEQAVANATTSVGTYVTTKWSAILAAIRTDPETPQAAPLSIASPGPPALSYGPSP